MELPKSDWKDILHSVAKGTVSCVPGLGGILGEVFGCLVAAPLQKRLHAFLAEILADLERLRATGAFDSLESLAERPEFVSAIAGALEAARRTHDAGKLAALRAIVNATALRPASFDEDGEMFLALVDRLTPTHLRVLKFIAEPRSYKCVIDRVFPDQALAEQAASDLEGAGLILASMRLQGLEINLSRLSYNNIPVDQDRVTVKREFFWSTQIACGPSAKLTELGSRFLRHISTVPEQAQ